MEIHHDELYANWKLLSDGERSYRIELLQWGEDGQNEEAHFRSASERVQVLAHVRRRRNKVFDVEPYAHGNWFGELRDPSYFSTVALLPNGSGIEQPDGQDIAPHELYELGVDA